MKKELGLAILFGSILGFTITGLFWAKKEGKLNFRKQTSPGEEEQSETTPTSPPAEKSEKASVFLEIKEPENEIISREESLVIKGETVAEATVVVIWEEGEDILVADENGQFETEITLIGGENVIEISSYDDEGNDASENLIVTYSTAKI